MALILVVEDETKIREKIADALQREGHQVETLADETSFSVDAVMRLKPAVLVLDRLLGRADSLEAVGDIKARHPAGAILILSAIDSPLEKARALEAGADDYLSKPFSMTELLARVKALQRRAAPPARSPFVKIGNVVLDLDGRVLISGGKRCHLPNKEFGVLRVLAAAPGRVFNKQQIFEQVWDASSDIETNAVETTITSLRKRLVEMNADVAIKNMRNAGYWLETPGL